jgi:hypothetical protein
MALSRWAASFPAKAQQKVAVLLEFRLFTKLKVVNDNFNENDDFNIFSAKNVPCSKS